MTADILMLPGLLDTRSQYTPEEKVFSCLGYVLTGNSMGASKISGVQSSTIRKWKSEAPWWKEVYGFCRSVAADRLDSKFTQLLDRVINEIENRLDNGDEKVLQGEIYRVQVPANVLVQMLTSIFDKRQLIRGDVTTRTERVNPEQKLKEVKAFAEEFAHNMKEKNKSNA